MNNEELMEIKEKLYDNEKHPYVNNCRIIAKKLFEELLKTKTILTNESINDGEKIKVEKNQEEYIAQIEKHNFELKSYCKLLEFKIENLNKTIEEYKIERLKYWN